MERINQERLAEIEQELSYSRGASDPFVHVKYADELLAALRVAYAEIDDYEAEEFQAQVYLTPDEMGWRHWEAEDGTD